MIDVAGEGAEAELVRIDLAGQRHAHHGAAVERAGECDQPGAAGGGAGDLDRVFNRFRAGGEERGFLLVIAGRQAVDFFSQFDIAAVRNNLVSGMGEAFQLLPDGGDDFRVAVAGVEHRDAGGEIDVALAFDIPQFGILCARCVKIAHHADAAWGGFVLAFFPVLVAVHRLPPN